MANQYEKRKAKAKEKVMEDIAEPVAEIKDAVIVGPDLTITPTGEATDIFHDVQLRKYMKVTVEYDIVSGAARVKAVEPIADSQPVATQKMNEIFTRKILGLAPVKKETR